jgi:hypothetical protein
MPNSNQCNQCRFCNHHEVAYKSSRIFAWKERGGSCARYQRMKISYGSSQDHSWIIAAFDYHNGGSTFEKQGALIAISLKQSQGRNEYF